MSHANRLALCKDVFFHHLLTTRKTPFLASYKLTYRCNLRCQQCPFPDYPGNDPSFEQVCQVLDRLAQRGNRIIVFEGGEPLLWRDGAPEAGAPASGAPNNAAHRFADIARYARQRFACVGVTTNGTLPLETETDILWVSVDGLAETHNRLRAADIFDRVISNIRRSRHPRLYAHITANAENHAEIPALIRFLAGLVKGITLQFYYPYGEDDRLFLPWAERRDLLEQVIALKREGLPVMNSIASLRALQNNRWRCLSWLVDNASPDGTINQGCYLQDRTRIDCQKCGFSPYTEISLAFRGNPQAILAGMQIFTAP